MASAPLVTAASAPTAAVPGVLAPIPLWVALDGALLRTDSLIEAVLWLARRRPGLLLQLLFALLRGEAFLRSRATALAALDPQTLPINAELVAYLRAQRAAGRHLVLVSSADRVLVEAVAAKVGLFDRALGSDGDAILDDAAALEAARAAHGAEFAFAARGRADPAIWRAARAAVVVADSDRAAGSLAAVEARFRSGRGGLRVWVKALRLHQWSKNALLFVPLGLAGPLASYADYAAGLLGFLVFGLLASTGYLINDLLDLEADRRHRSKQHRPFAAGTLAPAAGIGAAGLLLLVAAALSTFLPATFGAVAAAYLAGTLTYSMHLKRVPMLDVLVLAGLFTVRILAGAMLTPGPLSFWLLTFSMFLFLSLALVKRYTELAELSADETTLLASRGYTVLDLPLILPLGLGSALASAVIFVSYLVNEKFPTTIYRHPEWLWFVFPILLFWLMRVWRLAVHGRMNDDPVLFALRDRLSLALGAVIGLLLVMAW